MDYLRMHAGWIRAHKNFLKQHPVDTLGFRPPKLTPDEVEQMEQNRKRHAATKKRLKRKDNLIGLEFGLLLVWQLHAVNHSPWWWCLCACGGFEKFQAHDLIAGRVTDCGCRESERQRIAKLRKKAA